MNYSRRKDDNLTHTLLNDMKRMNTVITRLQQELTAVRIEVQELRESVSRPFHEPKQGDTYTTSHTPAVPPTGWSRETGKFEKQGELLEEQGGGSGYPPSNPWDGRGSIQSRHTVSHF